MVTQQSTRRRAVVVYEEDDVSSALLQDILSLAEPERTNTLQLWLEAGNYDTKHDGTVLIGTPNRQSMQFRYQGEPYNVPPAGRRVTRENALRLLQLYGQDGRYYGGDQATGVQYGEEETFSEEQQTWASKRTFTFITNYLVQRPEKAEPVVESKPEKVRFKATLPEVVYVEGDDAENEEDNG